MQGSEENGFIVLKLDDGEDIMESLREAVSKFNISSGIVQTGIGMLRNAEIGYFDGANYHRKQLEDAHELVSLQGSITTQGEIIIHLHCALAGKDHILIGGHLFGGEVCVVGELTIRKLDKVLLGRHHNPKTGLKELTVG